MAGRPKAGLDYAGWSVNIFDGDTKIDKLLDAQGSDGFLIYFYLCQMAYKFDGYFYRWRYDDSASTARRLGCGIGSKTVENAVGLCLQIGLFDKPLFDRHGILTSRGIQRRYLAAIQGRRVKSAISDYWLLSDDESDGLVKCAANNDVQPANSHLQEADGHLQCADNPKSKVKKRKGNCNAPSGAEADFQIFWSAYPKKVGKQTAKKAFQKVDVPLDVLLEALGQQKRLPQWNKDNGQYIPNPATWLNQRRWEDEITTGGDAGGDPFKQYF